MAPERLPMRHIREILRLKWIVRRSHRETARSLGISAGPDGEEDRPAPDLLRCAHGLGPGSVAHRGERAVPL